MIDSIEDMALLPVNVENPREIRNLLGQFATGVTVITTRSKQGRKVGMTANSFSSLSLDPPLILWSLSKTAPRHVGARTSSAFWAFCQSFCR